MEDLPRDITVNESYQINPKKNTFRTQAVKDAYGIDFEAGELTVIDDVTITVDRGQIIFATGASGAGKTTFCRSVAEQIGAVDIIDVDIPADTPIIELFPTDMSVNETQRWLSTFGLTDANLNLRTYAELSEGQKYRAKLTFAAIENDAIFADEYCATLDRVTAKTISRSIRRQLETGRIDTTFIFATTHRDMIDDLRPDWFVDFDDNTVKKWTRGREALESVSQIVSKSHEVPKRTGRISLSGIT